MSLPIYRLSPLAPLEEAGELVAEVDRKDDLVRIICLSGRRHWVSSDILIEEECNGSDRA